MPKRVTVRSSKFSAWVYGNWEAIGREGTSRAADPDPHGSVSGSAVKINAGSVSGYALNQCGSATRWTRVGSYDEQNKGGGVGTGN